MTRVVYLCEFPSINGGENSQLSFLQSVREQIEPIFLCPPSGQLAARLDDLSIERHEFSLWTEDGTRKDPHRISAELLAMLHAVQPELVHANSLSMSRILGRVAPDLECPAVGHVRDILKVSSRVIADLAQLNLCLAVSDATRDWYVSLGLPQDRIVKVYNGIDPQAFCLPANQQRPRLRESLGVPSDGIVIGGVGQIGLRKAWHLLLDAVEILMSPRHEFPEIHVVLAGQRHSQKEESIAYEQALLARAQAGMLAGRLHLVGYWQPMAQFLEQIDLLAHPAYQEPLGRVLLEAAAVGTPVVATDVGGTREIFGEHSARLVQSGCAEAFAAGLADLLLDPSAATARANEASQRVRDLFSAERHAQQVLEYYRKLTGLVDL